MFLLTHTAVIWSNFAYTPREQPIHLIDAYDGTIRCSYRAYDDADSIEAAHCITFTPHGDRIVGGYHRCIKIFHTGVPGKDCDVWNLGKTKNSQDGQKGIVSTLAFQAVNPNNGVDGGAMSHYHNNMCAVGTFAGSIFLYDDRCSADIGSVGTIISGMCVVGQGKKFSKKRRFRQVTMKDDICSKNDDGNDISENLFSMAKIKWYQKAVKQGITQLQFAANGHTLFSASRRSNHVISWDIRMLTNLEKYSGPICGLASYARDGDTNQRIEFDLDASGQQLYVASRDRCVLIYDVQSGKQIYSVDGLSDAVNGISVASNEGLFAISTGERRFPEYCNDSNGETDDNNLRPDRRASGTLELFKTPS